MRTGIYLRISQDRTGEEAGVNRQREDCIALVDQLGWQTVEIYQDNDISASSSKPRPAYRRMITDIEADRINAVVAWHTDRLYRRLRDLEELAQICTNRKLLIRTCRAGEIDLSTPTGQLIAEILGSVAKHEVAQKADRWKRSFRQGREVGRWFASGPRTFGYDREGKIVEDEAQALLESAHDLLAGDGFMQVCKRLNEAEFTTTRGNLWTPTALRLLLTNPRIAGLVTVKGEIIGPGTWKPILHRGTWEQLRAAIADRQVSNGSGGSRPRSLLSGLALCGHPDGDGMCGKPLVRSVTSVPVYQCRVAGTWSSRHVTISAARLEEMVEAAAQTALADPRVLAAIKARLRPGTPDVLLQDIEDYERELAGLRESLKAARHAETKGDIIADMDRVRDEIADHRARLVPLPDIPVDGAEWPDDNERRGKLIRLVVGRVVVAPATKRGSFDPDRVRIEPVTGPASQAR